MGKTPKKRFKGSDTTAADVAPLLQQYVQKPVDLDYREQLTGAMKRDTLTEWLVFLTQLPASVKQKELAGALWNWAKLRRSSNTPTCRYLTRALGPGQDTLGFPKGPVG